MGSTPLDAVDRGILYRLQQDAQQPITNIASALNVADNTVRNRIEKLEAAGIIAGYTVDVNYDRANIPHYYIFLCTARISERSELARRAERVPGVIEVMTVMTGSQNVHIKAAAADKEAITDIARRLDELGLAIEREHLIWGEHRQPYAEFQSDETQ